MAGGLRVVEIALRFEVTKTRTLPLATAGPSDVRSHAGGVFSRFERLTS